ncbi:MAG: MarR family transcriptional regulator [Lachnospiraceae bacterium]
MIRIAIVSPERSLPPIKNVIERAEFGCDFQIFIYHELSEIDEICRECSELFDVIFFSGELGYHYVRRVMPDLKTFCAFTAYGTKDVLSILLAFATEHPEISLNRVYIDFLTPLNQYMDILKYLPQNKVPYFFEDDIFDYGHLTARATELWTAGKIDYLITRAINNISTYETMGIPYQVVFPSEEMIEESITTTINEIRLECARQNAVLMIIIRLPFEEGISVEEREYRTVTLHKALVDWRQKKRITIGITSWFDRFELQSEVSASSGTSELLQPFVLYLGEVLPFRFRMGAGLHQDTEKSRYYAETAVNEAIKYGADDGFLVSGPAAMLTGPLSVNNPLLYNYANVQAALFAKTHGISEKNLNQLIGLFQQNPDAIMTAPSLGGLLNITARSANRILSRLAELGVISRVETELNHKMGRPSMGYRFNDQAFRESLLPQ